LAAHPGGIAQSAAMSSLPGGGPLPGLPPGR
jgi:hypothetical protein